MGGQHLNDLTGNQSGVHIEANQALGSALQTCAFNCDVNVLVLCKLGQRLTQRNARTRLRVRNRDKQLQASNWVVGNTANGIDVCTVICESTADTGNILSIDRITQYDKCVGRSIAALNRGIKLETDCHAVRLQCFNEPLTQNADLLFCDANKRTETQIRAEHRLLHIKNLNSVGREHTEEGCRDTRAVSANSGNKHRS